jgi:electron transfer flavoprotein alpha subunit
MAAVCAYLDSAKGKLKKSAAEVMGEASRLAGALGGGVDAVLIGKGVTALANDAAALGAERVLVVDGDVFEHFAVDGYAPALAKCVAASAPKAVLLAASVVGKDLAPALAAATGSALLADVTSIEASGDGLAVRKPVYAGKAIASVHASTTPVVATLRPNVFAPAEPEAGRSAPVETIDAGVERKDIRTIVREVLAKVGGKLDLTEADIIVSGGRGMKGPENWHLIEALAEAVGGVTGASRAVVDAGWRPHEEQVGQTGKTVSPKLYIAVGISGAIQHLAGMRTSKCIVAINSDAEAPIFKVADYGIVGDVFDVLPALTSAINAARG